MVEAGERFHYTKKLRFGSAEPRQRILVKGRVAFAWFTFCRRSGRSAPFGNVHDFAFSLADCIRTKRLIAGGVDKALVSPIHFLMDVWRLQLCQAGRQAATRGSPVRAAGSVKLVEMGCGLAEYGSPGAYGILQIRSGFGLAMQIRSQLLLTSSMANESEYYHSERMHGLSRFTVLCSR